MVTPAPVHPIIATDDRAIVFDLGVGSLELGEPLRGIDVARFSLLIERRLAEAGTRFGYGRWAERRELYGSEHFAGDGSGERRDVHLGVDLFCTAGTEIRCPGPARVHATANNARELDYGPVVILQHEGPQGRYFTLYGHLAESCLDELKPGQRLRAGDVFAQVGSPPANGNWPPHLHFQLIRDLLGLGTEFPGVASVGDAAKWLALSPLPAQFFADVDAGALDGR